MIRLVGLALAMMMMPLQAHALSCLAPSVSRTFHDVNAAPEVYVVVKGRLTVGTPKQPELDKSKQEPPKSTRLPARLRGTSMSQNGFNVPFDQRVTLEIACIGPWCGSVQNGEQVLAFVKREDNRYFLAINPCGGHVFSNPKPAMSKQVYSCFKGATCTD
ncbi:MAG: hypothetical protein WBB25_12915 [Sulfitobacter sp.]